VVKVGVFLQLLAILLNLYALIVFARVLIVWFPVDPYSPVARFLYAVTEPLLDPIRRLLPRTGMFDFSPLVATLLIFALARALGILAAGF
jgi:YggT family protein